MEIILVIVVIAAIIFVLGGIDNKPASSWSDEKLLRMYGKLKAAASAQINAGNHKKSEEHSNK